MDAATRAQFNMKVLKRHDPTIEDIIQSASFVVLYSHDGEWTKTGVEGPMFLYRRSANPPYGFFVLNRNGVENFSANLTMSDDLELSTEFIIYRASEGDDVIGIWIFEPSQRESVGQQMLKLQSTPITNNTPQPVSIASAPHIEALPSTSSSQAGQSISLDALFGTQSMHPAVTQAVQLPAPPMNGLSLLNSIFESASPRAAPAQPAASLPLQGAEGLKAMLGLQSTPAPPNNVPSPASKPSDLETLLASPSKEKSLPSTSSMAPPSHSAADIVSSSLQSRTKNGAGLAPSLNRRDFVREVLSLIHTDKEFVDDLYQRYLSSSQ